MEKTNEQRMRNALESIEKLRRGIPVGNREADSPTVSDIELAAQYGVRVELIREILARGGILPIPEPVRVGNY